MDILWQGFVEAFRLLWAADPELVGVAALSLRVSLAATLLSALVGVPAGVALATARFRGRGALAALVNTGMGLPPVVVGLIVTLLLWRTGPLGALGLLYTPLAMIAAQFVVAAPLVAGITRSAIATVDRDVLHALRADGAGTLVAARELVRSAQAQVLVAVAVGFGRAISEVGASLMVGGNLLGQTRVLTTAIALETSRGDFARAIALGIVLLLLAFVVNAVIHWRAQIATR